MEKLHDLRNRKFANSSDIEFQDASYMCQDPTNQQDTTRVNEELLLYGKQIYESINSESSCVHDIEE